MITKDMVRLTVAALIGLVAGVVFIVAGLDRSDARGNVYVLLGSVILACVALLAVAVLRVRWQQRGLSAEERAAARAARQEHAQRHRPGWFDSRAYGLLMLSAAAYWAYLLVRSLDRGAYGIAALDTLLLVISASAALRVARNRRPNAD